MKNQIFLLSIIFVSFALEACTKKLISLASDNLEVINRKIISTYKQPTPSLSLNNENGDGLAIVNNVSFDVGTIELELRGENTPGRSFVGIVFNILNDSTYEAVYFRPFNFQATEQTRRNHSVQYISHPKNTWRYLRTNYDGQYEAEYSRRPSPEEWFGVRVKINHDKVYVYDSKTNVELLNVERIANQVSNRIGLWTGNNSKGKFRNLRIQD